MQTFIANVAYSIKMCFNRNFWKFVLTRGDEEVLVDSNVMSYAYLEIGILESLGCIAAFFFVFYRELGITPSTLRLIAASNDYFSPTSASLNLNNFGAGSRVVVSSMGG